MKKLILTAMAVMTVASAASATGWGGKSWESMIWGLKDKAEYAAASNWKYQQTLAEAFEITDTSNWGRHAHEETVEAHTSACGVTHSNAYDKEIQDCLFEEIGKSFHGIWAWHAYGNLNRLNY